MKIYIFMKNNNFIWVEILIVFLYQIVHNICTNSAKTKQQMSGHEYMATFLVYFPSLKNVLSQLAC